MRCSKCQSDNFNKELVFGKRLDIESRSSIEDDKYEVLSCKKCHLTQWYDKYVISGAKKPERIYKKSIYGTPKLEEFECLNCRSNAFELERVGPAPEPGGWEGEIVLRVCAKCGLLEMYEALLVGGSEGRVSCNSIRSKERIKLAQEFRCPICTSKTIRQSGLLDFYMDLQVPKYMPQRKERYLFCTCDKCRHMLLFLGYLD